MSPTQYQLPDFGRQSTLALIIGNTRNFWKPFLQDYNGHKSLNPVDDYVERCVENAIQKISVKSFVKYAHERRDGKMVAIQRACHVSGLAYYDTEISHLCMHPIFGPWIALRAVIVFDVCIL